MPGIVYCNAVGTDACYAVGMTGVSASGPDIGVYVEYQNIAAYYVVYGYSNTVFKPDSAAAMVQGFMQQTGTWPAGPAAAMAYVMGDFSPGSVGHSGYKRSTPSNSINDNGLLDGPTGQPVFPAGGSCLWRFKSGASTIPPVECVNPASSPRTEIFKGNATNGSIFGWGWGLGSSTAPAGVVTKFKVYDWGAIDSSGTPPPDPGPPTGNFFLDTYTGTVGTTLAAPRVADTGGGYNANGTIYSILGSYGAGLQYAVLRGDGTWAFDSSNPDTDYFNLRPLVVPTSANYAVEIRFELPVANPDVYLLVAIVGRTSVDPGDSQNICGVGVRWDFSMWEAGGVWQIFGGFDGNEPYSPSDPISFDDDTDLADYSLTGAAQSLTLRVEFEGRQMRAFHNGTLVGTMNWSGTTRFDAPGGILTQFRFMNFTGNQYYPIPINQLVGTYNFLGTAISQFWTDFDLTQETFSGGLLALAEAPALALPVLDPLVFFPKVQPKRKSTPPTVDPHSTPLTLTLVDSFYTDMQSREPRQRVAFDSAGQYCAVGVMNDYGPGSGVFPAEVWIYKLSVGHWARVARLVTNTYWDNVEAWQVAIADNGTVLAIGNNSAIVHRWKRTGTDVWAVDSFFQLGAVVDTASHSGIALSADGNVCVAWSDYNGGRDARIFTGVSATQTARQTISASTSGVMGACLSADGKRLALGRLVNYSSNAVEIWTSTTLGSNSWTVASTIVIDGSGDEIQGMQMTAGGALIAVGVSTSTPRIVILQNTGGNAYTKLGSYVAPDGNYSIVYSFGLSNGGALIVPDYQTYTTPGRLWTEANVATISGETILANQHVPLGTATDWVCSGALAAGGNWVCLQGGGETPASANSVLFCTAYAVPPGTSPIDVFWVYDSYTDVNNADIEAHVGEIGATWTRTNWGRGTGNGRTFGIFSNALRRMNAVENPGGNGGEAMVAPSGLLPAGATGFAIEFEVYFQESLAGYGAAGYVALYQNAVGFATGNVDLLMYIGNGFGITFTKGSHDTPFPGVEAISVAFTATIGQHYVVRLECLPTGRTLKVDGTVVASCDAAAFLSTVHHVVPTLPIGLDLFDSGGGGGQHIEYFRISSSMPSPPGQFWTDFDLTRETLPGGLRTLTEAPALPTLDPMVFFPKVQPPKPRPQSPEPQPLSAFLTDSFDGSGTPDPLKWARFPLMFRYFGLVGVGDITQFSGRLTFNPPPTTTNSKFGEMWSVNATPGPDASISADVFWNGSTSSGNLYLGVRMQSVGPDVAGYFVSLSNHTSGGSTTGIDWSLAYRNLSGSDQYLSNEGTFSGLAATFKLDITGTVLTLSINGSVVSTSVAISGSTTTAGRASISSDAGANGIGPGYFSVDNVAVTAGVSVVDWVLATFTGTDGTPLTTYVGEIGATFTPSGWYNGDVNYGLAPVALQGGDAGINNLSGTYSYAFGCIASGLPPIPDYSIEAEIQQSTLRTGRAYLIARRTAFNTFYELAMDLDSGAMVDVYINKKIAGTNSLISAGSPYFVSVPASTFTSGVGAIVRWDLIGNTQTVFINGVLQFSVTDSAILVGGQVGFVVWATASNSYAVRYHKFHAFAATPSGSFWTDFDLTRETLP